MNVELSYPQFYELMMHVPQVRDLLGCCISERATLRLSLESDKVSFSLGPSPRPEMIGPLLIGRWRSPLLKSGNEFARARLMAPLLFLIEELWLPHKTLYTL